ncbi:glycyl-radical enzyme activating protein [Parabacteroides sp. PF5-9]|uniref:glycyl-radical enzyme activating protein n=1 Tax=Parabacteroides sp. PF5-9 TaxID=1742404 RepID=UPI002473E839|nr:glycyl-radical enzyme activating protein [Parabacteroides sp. PF5-9]
MPFVFDVKRYAVNDGPGIRVTLFFKGCPLSCIWCHNPEGISYKQEKMYTFHKCIGCRTCIKVCPQKALTATHQGIHTDKMLCTRCGICVEHCPSLAMELSGKVYTTDNLMKEIEKETLFMDRSGGGVTFCGGEPFMHPDFLFELLQRCGDKGIHRAIDTSLYVHPEILKKSLPQTDLFLVDLKQMNTEKHLLYCGVPNALILSNIRLLSETATSYIIRIPLIEGINADEENIKQTADFLSTLPHPPQTINLLPYHDIGKGKHDKLNTVYNSQQLPMAPPSEEKIKNCRLIFEQYKLSVSES